MIPLGQRNSEKILIRAHAPECVLGLAAAGDDGRSRQPAGLGGAAAMAAPPEASDAVSSVNGRQATPACAAGAARLALAAACRVEAAVLEQLHANITVNVLSTLRRSVIE